MYEYLPSVWTVEVAVRPERVLVAFANIVS